ncbi:MAG: hypothetical protein U9R50_05555, partial [Campylobacterota bacterium]|nr:hypothetical protein [Campylobacterota bacterium]
DGNMSAYEGELSMQTSYENVMLENLKLHMNNNKYSSDFFIQSHDLEKGVVILPDILVDKTRFDGNFTYNESAVLHVNNSAMYFSEAFHQKIDANASGKLHLELLLDLKYHKNMLDIALTSQSPYYDIHTFNTQIDLNQSLLLSTLEMTTNQAQDTGVVNLKMHYTNPYHIDAILKTKYEQIEFKNVMVDINNTDINGTYTIALQQTPKKALFQHGLAKFKGAMTNKPLPKATLHSNSFDGVFNIIATQKNITIDADAISLEKVMNFLDTKSALQAGVLDIDVSLESDNFLELNITSLKGDISLDATELILEGFDADKSINTLKNYQDISIFDGNIPGMGIVSSIVKAPVNLVSQHEIPKSEITQVHIDSYLENGMFYCHDCALKTEENRIALKGAIDINSTNFHYFEVGLLKDNGCAFFTQDIKGSVKKPDIALSKTSLSLVTGTIKSVGGVVKDGVNFGTSLISKTGALVGEGIDMTTGKIPLVNKATGAVSGTLVGVSGAPDSANNALTIQCQPFYRGVVSHPQTFISH